MCLRATCGDRIERLGAGRVLERVTGDLLDRWPASSIPPSGANWIAEWRKLVALPAGKQPFCATRREASHYLIKPFKYADLAKRLRDFERSAAALAQAQNPGQSDVDALFARSGGAARGDLPKGLSQPTAKAVLDALKEAAELSAAECAEAVGLSRVTARRYLEHLSEEGIASVHLRYGTAGGPERRYRIC